MAMAANFFIWATLRMQQIFGLSSMKYIFFGLCSLYSMVNIHLFQVGLEVLGLIVQVLDVFETLACLLIEAR
jgi:hypothetical protein